MKWSFRHPCNGFLWCWESQREKGSLRSLFTLQLNGLKYGTSWSLEGSAIEASVMRGDHNSSNYRKGNENFQNKDQIAW